MKPSLPIQIHNPTITYFLAIKLITISDIQFFVANIHRLDGQTTFIWLSPRYPISDKKISNRRFDFSTAITTVRAISSDHSEHIHRRKENERLKAMLQKSKCFTNMQSVQIDLNVYNVYNIFVLGLEYELTGKFISLLSKIFVFLSLLQEMHGEFVFKLIEYAPL